MIGKEPVSFIKNYKTALGWIIPELQLGLPNSITERGIRPTATFRMGIKRDYTQSIIYDTAVNFTVLNEIVETSQNYIQPSLLLDMGGLTVFSKPDSYTSLNFDYAFSIKIYNNNYNYKDINNNDRISSIKGLNTGNGLTENRYMQNSFTSSVDVAYNGMARLKFIGRLSLPVNFVSGGETSMDIKTNSVNGELQKQGDETSLFAFQFSPSIKIGFQYKIIPEELYLSAGGNLQFAAITLAISKSSLFIDGVKQNAAAIKTKYTNFGEWNPDGIAGIDSVLGTNQSPLFSAGLTFFFNEKFILDIMTGLNPKNSNDSSPGFIKNSVPFSGILLSLKI